MRSWFHRENMVQISQTVQKLWHFLEIQYGSWPPSWIYNKFIFDCIERFPWEVDSTVKIWCKSVKRFKSYRISWNPIFLKWHKIFIVIYRVVELTILATNFLPKNRMLTTDWEPLPTSRSCSSSLSCWVQLRRRRRRCHLKSSDRFLFLSLYWSIIYTVVWWWFFLQDFLVKKIPENPRLF